MGCHRHDRWFVFGRINEHYHVNGYLGEVRASHSLGKMMKVCCLGSCYSFFFSNYYFTVFNIFVLQMIQRPLAFYSRGTSVDGATCTLSFDIQDVDSPSWCVLPFPLCIRLPHKPASTLLQSLLKSDILIKSLALVTTAHISSSLDCVRSDLIAGQSPHHLQSSWVCCWPPGTYIASSSLSNFP